MRSCLHARTVRTYQPCVSPLSSITKCKQPLQRQPAIAAPHQQQQQHQHQPPYQQQRREMNVAAAAVPALNAALAGISIGVLAAWLDARLKSRKPDLYYTPTEFNSAVLDRCPTMQSTYQCIPFLTNGHAETILVAKLRKPPRVVYKREILVTKDGGAVAIDWEHFGDDGKDLPQDAPVLILFPGLTGGSGDSYVQHAVLQARHAGVRAAVFNSRGTADSPVLTPQFYSASFTDDTREVIAHVRQAYPSSTLFAAGWSLGANILVNYLGEQGPDTPLEAAVSMCNPFDLTISNRHINEGFNKIYNWNLASSLKRIFLKHQPLWRTYSGPGQPERIPEVKTIREFDEAITVHSFDWEDVDAYYAGSSSAKRIPNVAIPLLCIQAADDPIAPEEAIPYEAIKQNPNCTLVVTPCGGHLGWAAGPGAPFSEPWTDAAVVEWLTSVHAQLQQQEAGRDGITAAQQQAARTAAAAGRSSSAADRGGDDDDNSSGSNGGGASVRELEPAGVAAAGRSTSSSSALTIAAPLSRQASSSSSNGSSAFLSPVSSSTTSHSSVSPRLATAGSSGGNSVASVRSRSRQQQQQQEEEEGGMLAASSNPSVDLMEQLWWGQGASLARNQTAPAPARQLQQQQQQWVPRPSRLSVEQSVPGAAGAAASTAAGQLHAPQALQQQVPQEQEWPVFVSPFADVAAPEGGQDAAAAAAAAAHVQEVEQEALQPPAGGAVAASTAAAASAGPAPVSDRAHAAAVEQAQAELWQSVRFAF